MFIELVDSLRCVASHEETWLVASVSRMDGRHVVEAADEEGAVRAAALLGLTEPGGIVVLGGSWSRYGNAIAERGAAHVVMLNASARDAGPQEVSSIAIDDRLPFAVGSVRAIALGPDVVTPSVIMSATRALRSRGRLIVPANADAPDGVAVLARDEDIWVGERTVVASPPVTLRSSRR